MLYNELGSISWALIQGWLTSFLCVNSFPLPEIPQILIHSFSFTYPAFICICPWELPYPLQGTEVESVSSFLTARPRLDLLDEKSVWGMRQCYGPCVPLRATGGKGQRCQEHTAERREGETAQRDADCSQATHRPPSRQQAGACLFSSSAEALSLFVCCLLVSGKGIT